MFIRNTKNALEAALSSAMTLGSGARLQGLYVELLVYILSLLGAQDLASVQLVSRAFYAVVRGSLQLQWTIECFISGVEDGPSGALCLKDRVDNLRSWRIACKTLRFTDSVEGRLALGAEVTLRTFGTIYAALLGNSVAVSQPTTKLRAMPEKEWMVHLGFSGVAVETFTYEDMNQLLVVVEYDQAGSSYKLHLYSTVTGGAHPLANNTLITIPLPQYPPFDILEGDRRASVSVCDSVLSFKAEGLAFCSFSEIWVWDWKTGEVLLNLYGDAENAEPHYIQLMDPLHCLVSYERGQDPEFFTDGIAVFSLRPGNPFRQEYLQALRTTALLRMELPDLNDDAGDRVGWTLVAPKLGPAPSRAQTRDGAFRRRDDTQLLYINYRLELHPEEETQAFAFVTRAATVYAHLAACAPGAPPRVVLWEQWASDARCFAHPADSETFVTGTRFAVKVPPSVGTPQWTFRVYDFRPSVTRAVGDADEDAGLVTDGFELEVPELWDEPVEGGARLPYRDIVHIVAGSPDESAYLGEDYLVIVGGGRTRVYSM